jgi:magnesium transporter
MMEIHTLLYSQTVFKEKKLVSLTHIADLLSDEAILWVDIINPKEKKDLEDLEEMLGLHPLALEDCVNIRQRPKVEDYKNNVFIISRGVDQDLKTGKLIEGLQLGLLFGKGFVVTIHKDPIPQKKIIERIKKRRPSPDQGISFLIYTLLDLVVDDFEEKEREMEDSVSRVEGKVLRNPTSDILSEIFVNRQNLLFLRKLMRPQRDAIRLLVEKGHPLIHPGMDFYLRDVLDHVQRTLDSINTQLDITNGSLDIYLSSTSNKMNSIMKMLTVLNTIFMPLTLVIGLYQITFQAPYPVWEIGPNIALIIMAIIVFFLIIMFKKIKWI